MGNGKSVYFIQTFEHSNIQTFVRVRSSITSRKMRGGGGNLSQIKIILGLTKNGRM
jgi:hypothetical protein